jgi:hypothetical protein
VGINVRHFWVDGRIDWIGNCTEHASGVAMEAHSSNTKHRKSPLSTVARVGLAILGIEFGIMRVIDGVLAPLFGAKVTFFPSFGSSSSPFFWPTLLYPSCIFGCGDVSGQKHGT